MIGTELGPLTGKIEADRFGPFYAETFINTYLLFILPNMFFAGAIIFAIATKWKNTIISFLGTIVIIVATNINLIRFTFIFISFQSINDLSLIEFTAD